LKQFLQPDPALLTAALDSIPLGILIADHDGLIVWVNHQLAAVSGYHPDDLTGMPVTLLADIRPGQNEILCRRKSGDPFIAAASVKPLEGGHSLITLRETRQDIDERSRLISENSVDVIWLWNLDEERCVFVTPSVERLRGFTQEEALRQSMEQALAPDSFKTAAAQLADCIARVEAGDESGRIRINEFDFRRKDGSLVATETVTKLLTSGQSKVQYILGVTRDITERNLAQQALVDAKENYRKIFEGAIEGIYRTSIEGRPLAVNPALARMLGYDSADECLEAIGNAADVWLDLSERARFQKLMDDRGTVQNFECRLRRKDGRVIWVSVNSRKVRGPDGEALYNEGFMEDITERRQAEERSGSLATAIEQAAEQFVITDLKGSILYCNPAFEKATGFSKEEVLGRNPRVLKSGKQTPEFYRQLWDTIGSGSVWTGRFTNKRKDGSLCEEDATISPIRDVSGRIKGYVAIKRDVSERIQLENQFRQAQKLESVGRLAGGVAHDFNNLLTVINGYSGLLMEELQPPDPLWPYADEIRKAGERAAALTRQLLAFSRKQVIEVKAVDLNAIVKDAERMLRRLIGEDVELRTNLDPLLGVLMADPDQLHQVIMNLVVNARDAMPEGGKLLIETRDIVLNETAAASHPDAVPGRYVLMSVADTGTGMDEMTLEHIFEPFFTTKEQGKGTGLGLSTVYGIVRQNGGWVEVSSQPSRGTTFRIYLPRVEPGPEPSADGPAARPAAHTGGTVLLVEDQEEVRKLAKTILKMHGFEVIEARNGMEADMLAREYSGDIQLLLTDVVMPGMSGKELCELLRSRRPTLKVLFSSGYTADVIAHRGVLEPHVAYLPKPFTALELVTKVREVLLDQGA
jgi:two-component system cell cycle sensor histidine kinase/response regulator CckA